MSDNAGSSRTRIDKWLWAARFFKTRALAQTFVEKGRIRLTRNPEIPCLLLEGGYLSNAAESRLISDPGYRQKLAHAIAGAIRTQAATGDAGTGPLPGPLYEPPSRPTDTRE